MILEAPRTPLRLVEMPAPEPGAGEVRLRVHACAVCRTDLHVIDGELAGVLPGALDEALDGGQRDRPKLPLVLGHQIVGTVLGVGAGVRSLAVGDRVGVPWLAWTCGECAYCRAGQENLCDRALFTGYDRDGGFAEECVADARYVVPLPSGLPGGDAEIAPLLCAGLIGYRALRMAGPGPRLGFYGFGAAAHVLLQVVRHERRDVFAFTRPGDREGAAAARRLGAAWAGGSDEKPPAPLDGAILFAPVGALVPAALAAVKKGGTVVCAGIHMSDIPPLPYSLLWGERVLRSVANLTRKDAAELLPLAAEIPIRAQVTRFALADANAALDALRRGTLEGSAVVLPGG